MTCFNSSWTWHPHPIRVAHGSDLIVPCAPSSLVFCWTTPSDLKEEALRTLFTESANIINSCLLTIDNLSDTEAPDPIAPNHLLTLEAKGVLLPWGNCSRPGTCFSKAPETFRACKDGFNKSQSVLKPERCIRLKLFIWRHPLLGVANGPSKTLGLVKF